MNALLLSLVLSCNGNPNCAECAGKTAKAATPAGATTDTAKTEAASCDQHAEKAAPAKTDFKLLQRGEKLKGLPVVAFDKVMAAPADFDGKSVALEAKVRKACEKKGCWMELAGSDKGPGMRVTFKNYGFFVPLDSAGSTAKVEGTIKVAALTDENAKHLEAEGATIPRGKDGKPREVQLVAVGVELRR